jgi:hypothetical protein
MAVSVGGMHVSRYPTCFATDTFFNRTACEICIKNSLLNIA